jgi:hypothetical protein
MSTPPTAPITQQQPSNGQHWPLPIQVNSRLRTPVYGTAEPEAAALSRMREQAYRLPFHNPMHWLLLLGADRAEVATTLAQEARQPNGSKTLLRHFGRQMRGQPKGTLIVAGTLVGLALWRRLRQ